MGIFQDFLGTINTAYQIGIGGTGLRRLRFKNAFTGDLEWTPTAARTITLPDKTGTLYLAHDTILLTYQLASGTDSGTSSAGWNTFPLNTELLDTGNFCTLSSNRFALSTAGTYEFFGVNLRRICVDGVRFGHQIRVRNISDSTDVSGLALIGVFGGGSDDMTLTVEGRFTIAATKTFEIQIYASAQSSFAWGIPASISGYPEVYGCVGLRKIA